MQVTFHENGNEHPQDMDAAHTRTAQDQRQQDHSDNLADSSLEEPR